MAPAHTVTLKLPGLYMCYNWLLVYHMHGRCRGFCFVMFSCFLLCLYHVLLYDNSSCAATLKVGPCKLRPYSQGTRKATLSGGALIPCCLLKSSWPCKISSWSIVESHPSSLTFLHLQKAQTKLTGVDDFQRFLSCMVTRHSYSMYCTSSTVTIGNTETPRKSLLRMRNDKSACNLEPFHATLSKIKNKNQHDTTSLSLQFQLPAVKSGGTDNDTSPVKGALTHPEGC